ncbi:MAG: hypothetical protein JWR20_1797 [Marmoricola sp.]|nr:hypothetical protein [Marmoricola sp.]MCW2867609.1 hypothetical protein [Marmoricola sp.]
MEPLSRSERAALCNTALEAGQEAPTLCDGWTVQDLVIHLLVRERDPLGAPGILVPALEGLTRRSAARLQGHDFTALVERVRGGPPRWSPLGLAPVDRAANTLEFFVHHEDIRRARSGWEPRELTDREQAVLWKTVATAGKGLVRRAGVPVEVRWDDGERTRTAVLRRGEDPVVLTGQPSELVLLLFGRDQVREVSTTGPEDRVARLRSADLGL